MVENDQLLHPEITGIHGDWFHFLQQKDKTHLWLGVLDEGLFEIDVDTLQAQPFPLPPNQKFHRIDTFFEIGSDFYLLDCEGIKVALWRYRAEKWECLIEKLDTQLTYRRSWANLDAGLLISGEPSPWLIRENSPPVNLDWHYGLSAKSLQNLRRRPDGSLFALDWQGAIFNQKISDPSHFKFSSRLTELNQGRDLVYWGGIAGDHFWMIQRTDKQPILSEWSNALR